MPVPNPVREPNRCNPERLKPETPKTAPYLVLEQGRLTLQVVCLGLAHFQLPVRPPEIPFLADTREAPAGRAGAVWAVDRARRPGVGIEFRCGCPLMGSFGLPGVNPRPRLRVALRGRAKQGIVLPYE